MQERDVNRRARIYEFPKQLRLLQSAADDFLKEIFSPNAYEESPLLRGVYLTSATQEGQPIDHLSQHLSSGVAKPTEQNSAQHIRSYFIKRLLEDVIFPEQNLASTNRKHARKNNKLRQITIAVAATVTLVMTYAWWDSYDWNRQLIDQTQLALSTYQDVTNGGISEQSEVITLTKGLTQLQQLAAGVDNDSLDEAKTLGLFQGNKLKQPADAAYHRALRGIFVPI